MAWEWSHCHSAYEDARRNLEKKPLGWLMEVLAEWEASDWEEERVITDLDMIGYNLTLDRLKRDDLVDRGFGIHFTERRRRLADQIWERMEKLRTCTNGGHQAWACPFGCGCHLIPFS